MSQIVLEYDKGYLCAICYNDNSIDLVVECTNCGSKYHRGHLEQWLRIKSFCPICFQTMNLNTKLSNLPEHIQTQVMETYGNVGTIGIVPKSHSASFQNSINHDSYRPSESIQIGYSEYGLNDYLKMFIIGIVKFPWHIYRSDLKTKLGVLWVFYTLFMISSTWYALLNIHGYEEIHNVIIFVGLLIWYVGSLPIAAMIDYLTKIEIENKNQKRPYKRIPVRSFWS